MKRRLSIVVAAALILLGGRPVFAQACGCGCGMDYAQCRQVMANCPDLVRWERRQRQQQPQQPPDRLPSAAAQWGNSKPPAVIRSAISAAIMNPALPRDVKEVFATGKVQLAYRANVPRDLAYSVWFLKDNTLAIGPSFQDLKPKAQSQLLAFEFGKLIQRAHDTDLAFRNTIGKYPLPADLRNLPDVPALSPLEQDYPSLVGYAYYRYLYDRQTLIDRGLGGLVRAWDQNPPRARLK